MVNNIPFERLLSKAKRNECILGFIIYGKINYMTNTAQSKGSGKWFMVWFLMFLCYT